MKSCHSYAPFLLCCLAATPLLADQPVQASPGSAVAATPTVVSPWREKGELSAEEVIASLGIAVSPEQRALIVRATEQRNAALRNANADFSAVLATVLKADDAEVTAKIAAEKERRRMELMRRRQPSRYEALKKRQGN